MRREGAEKCGGEVIGGDHEEGNEGETGSNDRCPFAGSGG